MSEINQKEYLKKYLAIGKAPGEKRKRKKPKGILNRVKIIDDDAEANAIDVEPNKDPLADEYAPQIVAIIDERPITMRVDEKTNNPLWQPIGASELPKDTEQKQMITGFKITKPTPTIVDDADRSPPRRRKRNIDHSPPRKSNHSDRSPVRRNQPPDTSPIRKKRQRDGPDDNSPPRRRKEDMSPPRRKNKDNSPPRRRREDISPPRRKNNDNSPPRRRKEDMSPPRRINNDNSPPRRRKEDMSPPRTLNNDNSPPRRLNKDNSPPRRRNNDNSPPRRNRKEGNSPPRRRQDGQSPPRRPKTETIKSERSPKKEKEDKMDKTLDGKVAGLQNAQQLAEENKQFRARDNAIFNNLSKQVSGENAKTVLRDRKTGRIRNLQEEDEHKRKKQEEEEKNKEKYTRWGRGLVQVENRNQQIQDEIHEMSKPLARYADDEDLERYLKEQERDGDPMLAYIRSKKRKEDVKSGKPMKPVFQGEFMPNRYAIRPGHRWDGVDRSNGYEKKWFEVQNARMAQQEDSYKWSTEDM